MPKKTRSKKTQKRRITFKLEASEATEAILVGDFNSWDLKKHTMKKDDKGRWTKIASLASGASNLKVILLLCVFFFCFFLDIYRPPQFPILVLARSLMV
jgi:hypothetical protein